MVNDSLTLQVQTRASNRCEYCRMHQSLQGATFHVEHIVPRTNGGETELDNLAWACPSCNLNKSSRTFLPGVRGDQPTVPLFNPRKDVWSDHFAWDEFTIVGMTEVGAAFTNCSSMAVGRVIVFGLLVRGFVMGSAGQNTARGLQHGNFDSTRSPLVFSRISCHFLYCFLWL